MAKLSEMIQRQIVVIDTFDRVIYGLRGNLENTVKFYIGKPFRGDEFHLVEQLTKGKIVQRPMPGGDAGHTRDVFLATEEPTFNVLETWKWTGRKWNVSK